MVARRPPRGLSPPHGIEPNHRVIVPKLNKDPIWSLRPWSLEVRFNGQDFEIPPMSATEWLTYLMQPEPDLDALISDLLPGVEDLVFDLELPIDDLYQLSLDVISCASARDWWVALRLVSVARQAWDSLGPELLFKVNPNEVSLAAWLDAVLILALRSMDPKDTTMFTMKLEAVPVGMAVEETEPEMTQDAFLSLMN